MTQLPASVLEKNSLAFGTEDGGGVFFYVRDGQLEMEIADANGAPPSGPVRLRTQVADAMIEVLSAWRDTKLTKAP